MTVGIISLIINIAIASLLVAVIFYCQRLNRNIKVLQDSKGEMATLFAEFDASIAMASESITELQEATRRADGILKEKLTKADALADDLSFMIDRGNKTADQLEAGLQNKRTNTRAAMPTAAAAPAGAKKPAPAAKKPEKDEMDPTEDPENKLGPLPTRTLSRGAPAERPANARQSTASLESVLEQMANRNNPPAKGEAKSNSRIRSKAEQELFDSLKSGR